MLSDQLHFLWLTINVIDKLKFPNSPEYLEGVEWADFVFPAFS